MYGKLAGGVGKHANLSSSQEMFDRCLINTANVTATNASLA